MKLLEGGAPEVVFDDCEYGFNLEEYDGIDGGGLSGPTSTSTSTGTTASSSTTTLSIPSMPSTPTKSHSNSNSKTPSRSLKSKSKSHSRHTSLSSPTPTPQTTRHPDLWFSDGSVILRAGNTTFCVHMSQLARHSLVFHDMFMLPQPPPSLLPLSQVEADAEMEVGVGREGGKRAGMGDREDGGEEERDGDREGDSNSEEDGDGEGLARSVTLVSRNTNANAKRKSGSTAINAAATTQNQSQTRRVPVVQLYDNAEDVANLLTALYDGPNFTTNSPQDFKCTSGILRLSTKYLIDSLRAKALAHLAVAWPNDLRGWDAREDVVREWECTGGEGRRYPHPAAVIALAREVDAPSLLPSAFYDLSRCSFAQIYEPCEDDDLLSSSFSTSPSTASPLHSTSKPTQKQKLSPATLLTPQDIQRLCLGKECAQQMITNLIQSMGNGCTFRPSSSSSSYPQYAQFSPFNITSGLSTPSITLPPHPHPHSHIQPHTHNAHSSHTHSRKPSSHTLTCHTPSACRKDFTELVDLATQHYLFDRERGCLDPLYVAEELGQLKSVEGASYSAGASYLGGSMSGSINGTGMGTAGMGGMGMGMGGGGECVACARQLEGWAARERERIWKMVGVWFRLEGC
ncbi:hypothetical protein CPB83DRAFT_564525 [Crepidotus variabilis]|uniref:BTB domain-containing protein n=1 Tax=Crepidotus variabilis TaxID=179855 RepID=A0A9P6JLX5_9AGAR|nr:hypothetical protein CPB83DRAFT_564525 [Crepidotus variabilis]